MLAIRNAARRGDTDQLPASPEFRILEAFADDVAEIALAEPEAGLATMDSCCETTSVPVGCLAYRDMHVMHPLLFARYCGAVVHAGAEIEACRASVVRSCAVRFQPNVTHARIIQPGSYTRRDRAACELLASFPFVLQLDLALCFRLLDAAHVRMTLPGFPADKLERILTELGRLGGVRGLPVGGVASRVLAEAILHGLDATLSRLGRSFFRNVDDIIVGVHNLADAQVVVLALTDAARSMGLALNKLKTAVVASGDFVVGLPEVTLVNFQALLRTATPDRNRLATGLRTLRLASAVWDGAMRSFWIQALVYNEDALFPVRARELWVLQVLSAGQIDVSPVEVAAVRALGSPVAQHRSAALRVLAVIAPCNVVTHLAHVAGRDPSHFVRRDAILALARLKQTQALVELAALIAVQNPDAGVIAAAVLGLPWRHLANSPYRRLLWRAATDFAPHELPIANGPLLHRAGRD